MDRGGVAYEKKFPEIFNQTQDDPRLRKRKKPMEVLVLGMPRTGTMSIAAALEILGYEGVYHMTHIIKNPPDAWMWIDACKAQIGKGKPFTSEDWDHLLGNVQCTIDMPTVGVLPSLIAAYPEAKVLICERDVDEWYASMKATVIPTRFHPLHLPLWLLDTDFYRPFVSLQMLMAPVFFGPKGLEEKNAKAVYKEKYTETRRLVPESRRLEYKLEEGWEPLCKFLGKEMPKEPFPRINEGKHWVERARIMRWLAVKRVTKKLMPFIVAVAVAVAGILSMAFANRPGNGVP